MKLHNITSCPLYKSHKVEGDTIRISFTDGMPLGPFTTCGHDDILPSD